MSTDDDPHLGKFYVFMRDEMIKRINVNYIKTGKSTNDEENELLKTDELRDEQNRISD